MHNFRFILKNIGNITFAQVFYWFQIGVAQEQVTFILTKLQTELKTAATKRQSGWQTNTSFKNPPPLQALTRRGAGLQRYITVHVHLQNRIESYLQPSQGKEST